LKRITKTGGREAMEHGRHGSIALKVETTSRVVLEN